VVRAQQLASIAQQLASIAQQLASIAQELASIAQQLASIAQLTLALHWTHRTPGSISAGRPTVAFIKSNK
jgi:prefoldin subunit 5